MKPTNNWSHGSQYFGSSLLSIPSCESFLSLPKKGSKTNFEASLIDQEIFENPPEIYTYASLNGYYANEVYAASPDGTGTSPTALDVRYKSAVIGSGGIVYIGNVKFNGGIVRPLKTITADTALDTTAGVYADAGKTIVLNNAGGLDVTLPPAAGTGNVYKFFVNIDQYLYIFRHFHFPVHQIFYPIISQYRLTSSRLTRFPTHFIFPVVYLNHPNKGIINGFTLDYTYWAPPKQREFLGRP